MDFKVALGGTFMTFPNDGPWLDYWEMEDILYIEGKRDSINQLVHHFTDDLTRFLGVLVFSSIRLLYAEQVLVTKGYMIDLRLNEEEIDNLYEYLDKLDSYTNLDTLIRDRNELFGLTNHVIQNQE